MTEDLDRLPLPDWSPLGPQRFRIGYDFWRFPTGLVQSSRGCRFKCNYCPYLVLENTTRFRDPRAVVEEMRQGILPLGLPFVQVPRSAVRTEPRPHAAAHRRNPSAGCRGKIQFSIESRIELLPPEMLRLLKRVGLTSITVGIETPDDPTLRHYRRQTIDKDRQQRVRRHLPRRWASAPWPAS